MFVMTDKCWVNECKLGEGLKPGHHFVSDLFTQQQQKIRQYEMRNII